MTKIMDANTISKVIQSSTGELGLSSPSISSGRLVVSHSEIITEPEKLLKSVEEFAGSPGDSLHGWICFTDSVLSFEDGLPENLDTAPPILSAEICRQAEDQQQSLHIRQHGQNWRTTLITREVKSETADGSAPFLVHRTFLGLRDLELRYEIMWELNTSINPLSYRPALARFAGFSTTTSNS